MILFITILKFCSIFPQPSCWYSCFLIFIERQILSDSDRILFHPHSLPPPKWWATEAHENLHFPGRPGPGICSVLLHVFPAACTISVGFTFFVTFSKWMHKIRKQKYHLQCNENQAVSRFVPFSPKCQNTAEHCLQYFERGKKKTSMALECISSQVLFNGQKATKRTSVIGQFPGLS